jgi:tRNA threonylcarbamoyladenosine biosynthesis protein TsaB
MPTRLLAIDSATEVLHLALVCGDALLVRREPGGAQASSTVLPAAAALLAEAGLTLSQIDAFAFGRGPGAFTGLRTACSVVQGWALGTDRPVLPIDTLLIVAEAARRAGAPAPVWAMADARMGEVYLARYGLAAPPAGVAPMAPHWQTLDAPALLPLAEGAARVAAGHDAVAGTVLHGQAAAFAALGARAWPTCEPDGTALAALALAAHARGEGVDAALALPLYVRDKVAQTTAERRAAAMGVAR